MQQSPCNPDTAGLESDRRALWVAHSFRRKRIVEMPAAATNKVRVTCVTPEKSAVATRNIIARAAIKPIATLASPLPSIDLRSGEVAKAHYERSDICVVPAAGVIAEAMLATVLADACLDKFGGDNLKETLANYRNYLSNIP